ncbi:MAG: 30S ribosomal protein S17 [Anaeroplasmataceae bacterium]|nr:30S ribosomal protein S17 [Anaeroplasmataceae bacterium]MDE5867324.1 30S ribosomal protein S17 [Anaeroplasmataceae bacterium]MDE6013929.1 30S ribosomal protein S17 [Anaeroplasmataceae bacterium]MDE7100590.1 30S ribosomal protein S17 [Anaeroplasmataceae bacterium]
MERNSRKFFTGTVVSDKMEKTIVVSVDTFGVAKLYKKRVKKSHKFHVHDENNQAHVGDVVRFMETRPLSKTKCYTLVEIVQVKETI